MTNATAFSPAPAGKTRRYALQRLEITWGMFFLAPWVIGFVLLTAFPMAASLYISFTQYNPVAGEAPRWVGTTNYERAFGLEIKTLDDPTQPASAALSRGYSEIARVNNIVIGARDPLFWRSLRVTLAFAAISLPVGMLASIGLALLVNTKVPFVKTFRTLYYIPVMVPAVAGALILQQIINRDVGWLNDILQVLGLGRPDWNNDENLVLIGLTIVGLWGAGGGMIVYLAGLQGIPTELYEAAKVDGANGLRRFWHITIPMLTPVILYGLIIGLIGTFQYFTTAYILAGPTGAPNYSRYFYNMHLTRTAFTNLEMGYASALVWILLVMIILVTLAVFATTVLGTIGGVSSAAMVAYGFSRFRVPGANIMFIVLMATIMLPPQVTLIPMFFFFVNIGWVNTLLPLIVPHFFANAYNVFLLRQYFMTIPVEMDEAARVDGATPLQTFLHIIAPQAAPALLTITLLHFLALWNEFYTAFIYTQGAREAQPLSVALQRFQTFYGGDPSQQMAAALLTMIVPVALFFLAQRRLMQGIVLTGVEK